MMREFSVGSEEVENILFCFLSHWTEVVLVTSHLLKITPPQI